MSESPVFYWVSFAGKTWPRKLCSRDLMPRFGVDVRGRLVQEFAISDDEYYLSLDALAEKYPITSGT